MQFCQLFIGKNNVMILFLLNITNCPVENIFTDYQKTAKTGKNSIKQIHGLVFPLFLNLKKILISVKTPP